MSALAVLLVVFFIFSSDASSSLQGASGANEDTKIVFQQAPVDMNDILLDYDKKLRPNFGSKQGVNVSLSLHVEYAHWSKNRLALRAFLRETWQDSRLRFRGQAHTANGSSGDINILSQFMDTIWSPDTHSPSAETKLLNPGAIKLKPTGEVSRSRFFAYDLPCPISVDYAIENGSRINCSLIFESYWFAARDMIYQWKKPENQSLTVCNGCPGFSVVDHSIDTRWSHTTAEGYSKLVALLTVETGVTKEVIDFLVKRGIGD